MSVNIDDLSDPNFEFQYGFNPLRFIADYLKWWHPSSAEQRLRDRELAAMTLLNKAMAAKIEHGLTREQELMQMYTESGIVYGPMTTPISESSVLAVATGVIQSGHIAFELSSSADFSNIIQRLDVGVGRLNQAKALFENLEPSKKYFIRCSLFSAGELERQRNVAIKLQAAAEAEVLFFPHQQIAFYVSSEFHIISSLRHYQRRKVFSVVAMLLRKKLNQYQPLLS